MSEVSSEAFDALCAGTSFLAGLAFVAGKAATSRQLVQDLVAIEMARGKAAAAAANGNDRDAAAGDDDDDDDLLEILPMPRSRHATA